MFNGKPVILCTTDTQIDPMDNWRSLNVNPAYSDAIAAAGGLPLLGIETCTEDMIQLCDGLLLSGGRDVEPELYGAKEVHPTVHVDPNRTAFEVPLVKAFLEQKKPIFGICRGYQLLNAMLGGTMYQDIVSELGYIHANQIIRHPLYAEKDSILGKLFGESFLVNSLHHQAVCDLAPGLRPTARTVEGLIEGFEHKELPVFGVQFHPERLTGKRYDGRTKDFAPLFEYFVNLVRENAEARG